MPRIALEQPKAKPAIGKPPAIARQAFGKSGLGKLSIGAEIYRKWKRFAASPH